MYIDSTTSKYVLNNILNNNKIDFNKKEITKYKKEIRKLIKDYTLLYNAYKQVSITSNSWSGWTDLYHWR